MGFEKTDLKLLYKYAKNCNFIIETGGGGQSTIFLQKAAVHKKARFISIELDRKAIKKKIKGVKYWFGWSISYNDIIKKGHRDFIDYPLKKSKKTRKFHRGHYDFPDREIACKKNEEIMKGKKDLIRKAIFSSDISLDFFFCDSGEYCGIAEWNIVNSLIAINGYFAAHDIYYPKSIKCFKVLKKIEKNNNWKILEKTKTKQGLVIAQKIKD